MADQVTQPGAPGGFPPPSPTPPPGMWMPGVAPPPSRPPERRRSRSGCGTSFVFLLLVLVVIGAVVGGAVLAVRWKQSNDPAHQRTERIDDLHHVCDGEGVADVPAYRRGAAGQLGVRYDLYDDEDDEEERALLAFALVPGTQADPEAVMDARVMACTTSTVTEQQSCSFNDISRGPSLGGGNVTAQLPKVTKTDLQIVDVHSGKVLHRTTFETPTGCPGSLRISDEGAYKSRLPLEQIADQTQAQVALFHQG